MTILYLLIGISVLVASGFLAAFFYSVKHGQFEDDCTPAMRILLENKNEKNK
jgi:cbb3-type cytochrome oxidase maturation protein